MRPAPRHRQRQPTRRTPDASAAATDQVAAAGGALIPPGEVDRGADAVLVWYLQALALRDAGDRFHPSGP